MNDKIKTSEETAREFIRQFTDLIANDIRSRVGYAESEHKDEVLKGANIAGAIIEDRMVNVIMNMVSTMKYKDTQIEWFESQRKKLAESMQFVMSSIEDE